MGQRADRNQIDAGFGYSRDGLQRHAAGGLNNHAPANHRHGLAQIAERHIVEQHHIGAFRQNLAQLLQRVDLDLDFYQMAFKILSGAQRALYAAGDGDVVVLDQYRVVEAEAVIGAAAASHRVFFKCAQQRRGLARVANPRLGVGDFRSKARG